MGKSSVEFIALNGVRERFELEDAFQFRSDRPAKFLQKACIFIMKKLGANYIGHSIKIERHQLDARNFIDRLFKQRSSIVEFFNMKPTTLLIGAEDYAELMHEVAATQMFEFHAEYGVGRRIFGLNVKVIPWMSGCLVMPERY